jgi:SUKH-3 immunity protein
VLDDSLRPSPEAEPALRAAGWSPVRSVDISMWVDALGAEGTEHFPRAESILRSFGGLAVRGEGAHAARESFDVNPSHWIGMRDVIADAEKVLQHRLFPLGELAGDTMLAVLDDGRVISEFQGYVDLLGQDWSSALERLILGRGARVPLATDYVLVDH